MCCGALQRVAVTVSVHLLRAEPHYVMMQCGELRCSALKRFAVRCSVLQYVAACCSHRTRASC